MTVDISRELEDLVDSLMKSGRYSSPLEVITVALLALDQQEQTADFSEGSIQSVYPDIAGMVSESMAQARAGQLRDGEEFLKELEREEGERDASEGRKTV